MKKYIITDKGVERCRGCNIIDNQAFMPIYRCRLRCRGCRDSNNKSKSKFIPFSREDKGLQKRNTFFSLSAIR